MQIKWGDGWSLILKKIPAEARKNSINKERVKNRELTDFYFLGSAGAMALTTNKTILWEMPPLSRVIRIR